MVEKFDYNEMLDVANELLDEFGQDGIIYVPGEKVGDAWNPDYADGPLGPGYDCVCVETEFIQGVIDGTDVLATDKQVYVKAGDLLAELVPNATRIKYNDTTFKIIPPVRQINPAGLNLVWIIQARA